MDTYSFLAAKIALVFLAVILVIEYIIRRRQVGTESMRNRQKQQQLAAYSAELKELKTELARKTEIAEMLPLITRKMSEKLSADSYPAIAVRSIMEFFQAEKVGYFAPAEGSTDYTLVVGAGFPADWTGKIRIHPGGGSLGMALLKKVVVSRTDPHSAGRKSTRPSLEDLGVTPDFVAPVFGITGTAGALVVSGCPFPLEQERVYISMLADQLSTMLQNAALLDSDRRSAWVDHLTGVANRLYFLQRFESEIRRTRNYGQILVLFLFDIDEFKQINDTHGHHTGDLVILKMAEVVRKNTRSSDLLARYGGDEFVVLITSTTDQQAHAFAEKMREIVAATDIPIPGAETPLRITISGGLAIFPTHGQSTSELFLAADEALYKAKRDGRNRVIVASSVGLDAGIEKGAEAERAVRKAEAATDDTESGSPDYALGELGGNLRE